MRAKRIRVRSLLIWTGVAVLGAVAWGMLALSRGEEVSALWLLFAALCSYAIAYCIAERGNPYNSVAGMKAAIRALRPR